MSTASTEYCASQVRRFDRDRYLTALAAPPRTRAYLMALYAFNVEVAKTADVVSEAMLGQIRLQWWREALDELFDGKPRRHEVIAALAEAHSARPLRQAEFERILQAREADLEAAPMDTLDDLQAYARDSSGALLQLAAGALGDHGDQYDQTVAEAGTAFALARLLRAVPYHAERGRCYLPRDLLTRHGLSVGDITARRRPGNLAGLIRELAKVAGEHVGRARAGGPPPATLVPALLPAALAELDLSILANNDFDVHAPAPASESWRRPLLVTWRSWRGRP